jgi:hypothetical protein
MLRLFLISAPCSFCLPYCDTGIHIKVSKPEIGRPRWTLCLLETPSAGCAMPLAPLTLLFASSNPCLDVATAGQLDIGCASPYRFGQSTLFEADSRFPLAWWVKGMYCLNVRSPLYDVEWIFSLGQGTTDGTDNNNSESKQIRECASLTSLQTTNQSTRSTCDLA